MEGEPALDADIAPLTDFVKVEPIIGEISTPTTELREYLLEQLSAGSEVNFTLKGRTEKYSAPILDMRSGKGDKGIQVRLSSPRLFVSMFIPHGNGPATAEIYAR